MKMKPKIQKLLTVAAFVGVFGMSAVGTALISSGRVRGSATEEKIAEIDLGTFGRRNNSTGGIVYMPFDGIGLYTKTASGMAEITVPLTLNGSERALVLEYKNSVFTDLAVSVTLNAADSSYSLGDGTHYTANTTGKLTAATVSSGAITFPQAEPSHESFNGYAVLDLSAFSLGEAIATSLTFRVSLTPAVASGFGAVYALSDLPTGELDLSGVAKAYTPTESNFTLGGDTENYVAKFREKHSYWMEQPVTGDNFDPALFRFPSSMDRTQDGAYQYVDISDYKAIALNVDFSSNEEAIKLSVFLFNLGTTYNATRIWPTHMFGIGDNGAYFTYTSSAVGASADMPTVPAHFKGTIYVDLTKLIDTGKNELSPEVALAKVYEYFAIYNFGAKTGGLVHPESKLTRMYFTDTLPEQPTVYNVNVETNSDERGLVEISPNAMVISGSDVTVTPKPYTGYIVEKVEVNGAEVSLTDGSYVIEGIAADADVKVTFGYDPNGERFSWKATGEHVKITANKTEIVKGTDVVFTFSAEFGYKISKLTVNGSDVDLDLIVNNVYTLREVTEDVEIVVEMVAVENFATQLGESGGVSYHSTTAPGAIYANFDSVLVSSKLSANSDAIALASDPYVGAEFGMPAVTDWTGYDIIIVRYRQYHLSGGKANGFKILLADEDGGGARDTTSTVYMNTQTTEIADGDSFFTNSQGYISGGMIFTPDNFSGYVALPLNCFTEKFDPVEGKYGGTVVNLAKISNVFTYTEYKYTTDANARYAIGDMYLAKIDKNTNTISRLTSIWSPDKNEVKPWIGGEYPSTVTADDFLFIEKMQAGNIYLYDYSDYYKNTESALHLSIPVAMLKNGELPASGVKGIRLYVDNSANDFAIPYNVGLLSATNRVMWSLGGLGRVIFFDERTQTASYCAKNTNLIPANFKGEIWLPLDTKVFAPASGSSELPATFSDYIMVSFPTVSAVGVGHGTKFGFDLDVLTQYATVSYSVADISTDYTITYALNEGNNAATNPATYKTTDLVVLADAVREGYRFDGWYMNADFFGPVVTSLEETCGDITLYAKWGASHSVVWQVSEGGTVYPRIETIEEGDTVTFGVFPDEGYEIKLVTVNGKSVALSEEDTFIIENASSDYRIVVTFGTVENGTGGDEPQIPTDPGGGLSTGAIVGIVVGSIAIVVGAACVVYFFVKKKK